MAYSPTYTADDTAPVVIDILVTVLVVAVGFATLIGLIMLWRWFMGKKVLKGLT